MKNIVLSVWTIVVMTSLSFAGGGMQEVEPEIEPIVVIEEHKSGLYAGLGIAFNRTYSIDNSFWFGVAPTQDEILQLVGKLGYNFNEYISIEGRIGSSIDSQDYANVTTYSLFLKPQYPLIEDLKIYGLLGFGLVQVDGTDGNTPAHANMIGEEILNDISFQWGVGLSYMFYEDLSIFIDYTMFAHDTEISSTLYNYDNTVYNELTSDDLTIGFTYNF